MTLWLLVDTDYFNLRNLEEFLFIPVFLEKCNVLFGPQNLVIPNKNL